MTTTTKYTAVRLFAPCKAPKFKTCKTCGVELQYWRTGRGYSYLCPHCNRVVTEE